MDSVEGVRGLTRRVAGTGSDVAALHTAVGGHGSGLDGRMGDMERGFREALGLRGPAANFREAAGSGPRRADRDVAFCITGILPLGACLGLDPRAGPTAPVIGLMKEWGQCSAIIGIVVAGGRAGVDGSRVDAVVVVVASTFRGGTAVSSLGGALGRAGAGGRLGGVAIGDCFGTSARPGAGALTRCAGRLRERGDISGCRVIGGRGGAHLRVCRGGGGWGDVHVTDSDLDPYCMAGGERESGSAMGREVAPSAPPPAQRQHSACAPPPHPPAHPRRGFNSGGGARPGTAARGGPPTVHRRGLHGGGGGARRREETRRMGSGDGGSGREGGRRIGRLERGGGRGAAGCFGETAGVGSAGAVVAARGAGHAAAAGASVRRTRGHVYNGKHKSSNC
jgi:hypothetical protein